MRKRWAKDKANIVVLTGMAPSEYDAMTLLERSELIEALRRHKK